MGPETRKRLFHNIVRLRRAETEAPNPEITAVRVDLEQELGETVSRSLAAQLLGVSHTALNKWIDAGDVAVVTTREGRKAVPVVALVELYEGVRRERASGRRRLHTLEPLMTESRARAERLRPEAVLATAPGTRDRHRTSELRSLAYHRSLAPRLRRPMIEDARRVIRQWEVADKIDPRHAERWEHVLNKPVSEIRKLIRADTQFARDLRQNSPFAGLLSEPERRKILEKIE